MERKKQEIEFYDIESTAVMTGDRNQKRFLYYQLKRSMLQAKKIVIIVAFLMESGVKMLLQDLRQALDRKAVIRILTGNYLGITQPSALYLLKMELGNRIDLRFYNESKRSFHPKAYIFHREMESEIYIGSSNISRSALTSAIEWNYRFSNQTDPKNFNLFSETFEDLFTFHSIPIDEEELKRYSKNWKKPAVAKDLEQYEEAEEPFETTIEPLFQPRGAQIEALYALKASRLEGAQKALIQAATGIGKTYLAAFDSADYSHVLFLAHREEILKQAAASFSHVRQSKDYGFFYGKQKDTDKSVLFASVAALGKKEYLKKDYFQADYFDYIIIDETHHATNDSYQRILAYFKPKFLLGLTATPERMDGKNIYEIYNYHVPYEISLKEAINKGLLVPFHYYGIYDDTDYNGLHLVKGNYTEKELNKTYIGNTRRYNLIFQYYLKYGSKRALGFCCSKLHAEEMAKEFVKRGIPSVAVYSNAEGSYSEERSTAIERLRKGEIRVIFSVDMFNEGVDIPSIDMVLFLRPTEFPIIFLQQLGRGLRKSKGKKYLTVLDFIGNYKKAGKVIWLLSEQNQSNDIVSVNTINNLTFPEDCIVDFELRLIEVLRELDKQTITIQEQIQNEYFRIKDLLNGKVPTRMDLFTYMEDRIYLLCICHAKENPFRGYLEYLHQLHELSEEEELFYQNISREFFYLLETTDMQKSYKMPVLSAFCSNEIGKTAVTEAEVLKCWKDFYQQGTNWKDLKKGITYPEFQQISDKQHIYNIKRNPIRFLKESGKGFFVEKDGYLLALREELSTDATQPAFWVHIKDIITYRTMEYYRRRYLNNRESLLEI